MSFYKKNTTKRLFFHGNSLFHLGNANVFNVFAVSTYVRNNLTLNNNKPAIFDYSYQGKTTVDLTSEFNTVIAPYCKSGDVVIMWDGTNNMSSILGNKSAAQTLIDTKAYFTQAEALGLTVKTLTAIPRNVTSLDDTRRTDFNTLLLNDVDLTGKIINPCALSQFDAYADVSNATYYNADLVHLTTAGYDLIGGLIVTDIQSLFL
jgi:hypothetical protein